MKNFFEELNQTFSGREQEKEQSAKQEKKTVADTKATKEFEKDEIKFELLPGQQKQFTIKQEFKGIAELNISLTDGRELIIESVKNIERDLITSSKEFKLNLDAGEEDEVTLSVPTGFMKKPATGKVTITKKSSPMVVELTKKAGGLLEMLSEDSDFYEVLKEDIDYVVKKASKIWKEMSDEKKDIFKQLMNLKREEER